MKVGLMGNTCGIINFPKPTSFPIHTTKIDHHQTPSTWGESKLQNNVQSSCVTRTYLSYQVSIGVINLTPSRQSYNKLWIIAWWRSQESRLTEFLTWAIHENKRHDWSVSMLGCYNIFLIKITAVIEKAEKKGKYPTAAEPI